MGWGRTLLLGDIGNRLDIEDTERNIESIESDLDTLYRDLDKIDQTDRAQDERIADLERENRELKLYLAGMMRLLVSKGTLAAGEVEALVNGVERQEGPE
jgi:septal ring factor EnvC (AmiA/AmiB activator)